MKSHDNNFVVMTLLNLIAKINLYVDVPSVPDQNINLPELIYAKQSLINDKAVDVSGVPEHGVNLSRLIDDPTREIGR